MKWRTAWLIIGALALVCVGLVFSVVYPFSTTDLEEQQSVASKFDADDPRVYNFAFTHTGDEGEYTEFTGTSTETGEEYLALVDENHRTELYRPNRTAPLYRWYQFSSYTDFEYQRDRAAADPQVTIRSESRDGNRLSLLTVSDASSDELSLYPTGLVGGHLATITFNRVGKRGETITSEPRNDWLEDHRETYRITDATGSVSDNGKSNTIVAADVSWTRTAPVEQYADYALGRILETEQERRTYSIEYTTTDVDFDTPD